MEGQTTPLVGKYHIGQWQMCVWGWSLHHQVWEIPRKWANQRILHSMQPRLKYYCNHETVETGNPQWLAVIWKSCGGSDIVQIMNPFDATKQDLHVGEYEWGTRVAWLQAQLHTLQCCHVRFITDRPPLSTQKVTNKVTFSWALSVEVELRPDRKSNTSSTQPYIVSVDWLRPLPEGAPELPPGLGRPLLRIPEAGGPEALEAPEWVKEILEREHVNQFGPAPRISSAVMFKRPGVWIAWILQSVCAWKMSDTKVDGLWEKTTMHSIDLCHSSCIIWVT